MREWLIPLFLLRNPNRGKASACAARADVHCGSVMEERGKVRGNQPEHAQQYQRRVEPDDKAVVAFYFSRTAQLNSLKTTSSARELDNREISATSRAISEESFMETETSAQERAGESLMPSPTMHTVLPDFFNCWIKRALSSGRTWERYSVMPNWRLMARAADSLSP